MRDSLNAPDRARVRDHFSAEAENYQDASTSGLWDWWRGRERRALMGLLAPQKGERILDAGCGAGYYSEVLKRASVQTVSCDLSLPMAAQTARRLGVPTLVADLERLPLAPAFEGVLCAGALEFCPHPVRVLKNLRAVLAGADARIVIMVPARGIPGRLYRRFHRSHGLTIHLFSQHRLEHLAMAAGLRIDALRSIGFNYGVRFTRNAP